MTKFLFLILGLSLSPNSTKKRIKIVTWALFYKIRSKNSDLSLILQNKVHNSDLGLIFSP